MAKKALHHGLRPCFRCGVIPEYVREQNTLTTPSRKLGYVRWYCTCPKCGAGILYQPSREDARRAWNRLQRKRAKI